LPPGNRKEVNFMINPGKPFNIHDYLEIFLRRVFYFVIPLVLIFAGSVAYVFLVPKEYLATTLILVTPQKVPEEFVRPTVTARIEDRLQSIGQEIMSRTRLEQVIDEFNLYRGEGRSVGREGIVELMRKNIQVQIKGKEGYFTISYTGQDPRVVTLVTNKLASLFIEENLRLREQQAVGTAEFLSIELKATKAKLEDQERVIAAYKQKYMGELPEQREANLRVLDQLQMQSQRIGDSIKAAQDRKILIQKQLSDFELLINAAAQSQASLETADQASPLFPGSAETLKAKNPYESQLEQMKNSLADLRARYTEKHPDIVVTKKKIADLEAKSAEFEANREKEEMAEKGKGKTAGKERTPGKPSGGKREVKLDPRLNPRFKELENQVIAAGMEIQRLNQEDAKLKNQIAQYRERVENTPAREQGLAILTRDYNNTRETYASLLKKSQEAQQAENLERRQKGEQFKIIDPARIPEKPYRPDIPRTLLIGLFLGFFTGAAAAFFREQMDRSFRDGEDLRVALGFKVLANIPRIGPRVS
jgi:polysaccharide chain length determinant protein (PEP-CTERM system associated)